MADEDYLWWVPPPRQVTPAMAAWLRYFDVTKMYDRTLPGEWSPYEPNSWLPLPGWARAKSARYALRQYRKMPREHRADKAAKKWALWQTLRMSDK